ncbi:MAG: hypothetical protein R3D85_13225 [Paracoccaceae bacterium]
MYSSLQKDERAISRPFPFIFPEILIRPILSGVLERRTGGPIGAVVLGAIGAGHYAGGEAGLRAAAGKVELGAKGR